MTEAFIVDASVGFAWVYPSQASAETGKLREQIDQTRLAQGDTAPRRDLTASIYWIAVIFRQRLIATLRQLQPVLEEPGSDRTARLAAGCLAELIASA